MAIVFLWAGLTKEDPIKVLEMDVPRSYALFVACISYLVANLFIMIQFLRIGDILQRVDDATLLSALTKLFTHRWAANPFAFFGTTLVAKIYASCGFGLLIVVWWIGNASLYSLTNNVLSPIALFLQAMFLGIGLASMSAVQRVLPIALRRLETVSPGLQAELKATIPYRTVMTLLGIGAGGCIVYMTQVLT